MVEYSGVLSGFMGIQIIPLGSLECNIHKTYESLQSEETDSRVCKCSNVAVDFMNHTSSSYRLSSYESHHQLVCLES